MWNVAAIAVFLKESCMNEPAAYGSLLASGMEISRVPHPFCLGLAKEPDNVKT
jgi:hypothetical protein